MSKKTNLWIGSVLVSFAALIAASLVLRRSFALTAFSDGVQCFLLISATFAFIPLAAHSRGRIRVFWILIALGCAFWLAYQLFWTYLEVVLRRDVPELCTWDIVLFLHIVPFMAALGLRPHAPRDEYAARVGHLDFALLLVWWFYVYVFIVMPWQYLVPDIAAYDRNLNNVYLVEKIALLLGLFVSWAMSKGEWKKLYAGLFGMSLCYSASSTIANWAIARQAYYSGSLYDIPLVAAMVWLTWIGLRTKPERSEGISTGASMTYGVWVARFGMITVFSLPLFAAWAVADSGAPARIKLFRLGITLLAALFMGVMVFVRQRMLDRELRRLLTQSRDSFGKLKHLQAQILQSEKLTSVAQLVGGAAHELNNPITAMLGYSDLLLSTRLTVEQKPMAIKIGEYVRRTKSLVASLISFARQAPAPKTSLDLNTLARTAVKLAQPQWESLQIEIRTNFDSSLPKVSGDSNQLLQVCLQLLTNCLHFMGDHGGRILTVTSKGEANRCILEIRTESVRQTSTAVSDSSSSHAETGFGLSACQGILQEHHGQITCLRHENGELMLRVDLPATDPAVARTKEPTAPALWQSQPYA